MNRALLRNNAHHEAGHWVTGWVLGEYSKKIVLSMPSNGGWVAYCEREGYQDFENIKGINAAIGDRVINLLAGAKAESMTLDGFNNEIYKDLIADGNGAWPDFYLASELYRLYYRSLPVLTRGSFEDEWNAINDRCEKILIKYKSFIDNVGRMALIRYSSSTDAVVAFSKEELITLFNNCEHKNDADKLPSQSNENSA
ncbi:TPA: hypothetical protein ACX37L_000512 [Serratia marcescens]